MRWSDIDVNHAAVGFSRALVEGPTGPVLRPTKNRRTYRVALDPVSTELLAVHRDRASTRSGGLTDGFVFSTDPDGRRPWQPNWVTKRFITYRHRAGLASFRLHDLRHFMATAMLAAGVPVPVVSERLCHTRASTTVNIYAHAMPGADRDAANLLTDILNRGRYGQLQRHGDVVQPSPRSTTAGPAGRSGDEASPSKDLRPYPQPGSRCLLEATHPPSRA